MKSVLLIGDANTYFRIDYARNIKSSDIRVDILSFSKCKEENEQYYDNIIICDREKSGVLGTLQVYKKYHRIIKNLKKYDIIHIHSVKVLESIFSSLLKSKCSILISTLYGSDIYRVGSTDRLILRKLFRKSDYISIGTDNMARDFVGFFGNKFNKKIKIVPFGITQLQYIKAAKGNVDSIKLELGIPQDRIVVTIGYNATKEQHHLELINNIKKNEILKKAFYILPLSYGNQEYKKIVIDEFERSGIDGKYFCDFWPIEEVCKLRVVSDIMIQIQDTDAFSSSMNEYLYAGAAIITGAWLPYKIIKKFLYLVNSAEEVSSLLEKMIDNLKKYKAKSIGAEEFFDSNYSWQAVKPKWLALYEKES